MKEYIETLNLLRVPKKSNGKVVLDLFAGCGGLALGFEAAGYTTIGYECDENAVNTYKTNLAGECRKEFLTLDTKFPDADIVIGGPPCQPFSVGGSQKGLKDTRDGFPAFISAIRQVEPSIWMFENVRGMLYRNKWYLEEVVDQLSKLGYEINYRLLRASDYGVPQNRERLIVVGHKAGYEFPAKHSHIYTAGDALSDIAYLTDDSTKFLTPSQDKYVAKYEKASQCVNPRDLYLDRPARTLTCRNLAGATGDMQRIKLPDGRRKRLNIKEAARLQSFPDWFEFTGTESSQLYQIGNAVPPLFALNLAISISEYSGLNVCKPKGLLPTQLELV